MIMLLTAITIDSSENVGIGLTNQANKLQVDGDICIGKATTSADLKSTLKMRGANGSNQLQVFDLVNDGENGRVDFKYNRAGGAAQTIMSFGATVGNVGIGNSSPQQKLTVGDGADTEIISIFAGSGAASGIHFTDTNTSGDDFQGFVTYDHTADALRFGTAEAERMRINSSGNVGIGTSNPTGGKLHVVGNVFAESGSFYVGGGGVVASDSTSRDLNFAIGNTTPKMTLDTAGNVGIGTTSPSTALEVSGTVTASYIAASNSVFAGSGGVGGISLKATYSGATTFQVQNTGNVTISGALSKGSGSFRIDHPLESKKDTHHLVHSFVEAPQADLIYRGTATLSSGTATVNLDTVAGMTEGTYVLLNTNSSCFTSNETDWDAVKGSVSGNILTINCQNDSSTATVSWLVIGERQDQHMIDTDWTDENGKVIVEPTK